MSFPYPDWSVVDEGCMWITHFDRAGHSTLAELIRVRRQHEWRPPREEEDVREIEVGAAYPILQNVASQDSVDIMLSSYEGDDTRSKWCWFWLPWRNIL